MKPTNPHILTVNGGSSSIKFALFEANPILRRILAGTIERQHDQELRRTDPPVSEPKFTEPT
jgi:acetate kinase